MERPTRHVPVVSEADIVRAVEAARANQGRVRALGARGSKNGSHRTSGVALHLERYCRLLSAEDNLVTVQAGMTCGDLNAALERRGLALPTMGEWKQATVAGALLTGTHGGSSRHGILSTSLRRLRLVAGDGQARELEKGDPWFPHVGVSLGALGVVSTVTFECVEQFRLALETKVVSFERYLSEYERQNRENEF
ncbi:MAG: FAD-binding protein [Gemmatimonadetes bacterium]|nr:FAD-binding protein [Gemmatimonadota bacterium]